MRLLLAIAVALLVTFTDASITCDGCQGIMVVLKVYLNTTSLSSLKSSLEKACSRLSALLGLPDDLTQQYYPPKVCAFSLTSCYGSDTFSRWHAR
jgi:hypothetical protein